MGVRGPRIPSRAGLDSRAEVVEPGDVHRFAAGALAALLSAPALASAQTDDGTKPTRPGSPSPALMVVPFGGVHTASGDTATAPPLGAIGRSVPSGSVKWDVRSRRPSSGQEAGGSNPLAPMAIPLPSKCFDRWAGSRPFNSGARLGLGRNAPRRCWGESGKIGGPTGNAPTMT